MDNFIPRKFIYQCCNRWMCDIFQVDREHGAYLYGDAFLNKEAIRTENLNDDDRLDKQQTRTRIKQEKEALDPFKRPEDVELRQKAIDKNHKEYQGQEGYFKLGNQLARGKGATKTFDPLATPAARGTRKFTRKYQI